MSHPFGDLLTQYRARKHGLSQAKLAEAVGYDHAVIVRMCQGKKDLTGPSGRERVVRIIGALHDFGALSTLDEANALLNAAGMPPLYVGQPVEARLIQALPSADMPGSSSAAAPLVDHDWRVAPFNTFGGLLRHLRLRAELTQRELGLAVGYGEAQINRLEHSIRLPDVDVVVARFIPALHLEDEPKVAAQLIALAAQSKGEPVPPSFAFTHTHSTQREVREEVNILLSRYANLPAQVTSFIGREDDVAAVKRRLLHSDVRLLTLLGPPGVGKTRLAIQVASELSDAFADGVCFVGLATITDPNSVIPAIAQALGVIEVANQPLKESVKHRLQGEQLLLVLDNFEQFLSDPSKESPIPLLVPRIGAGIAGDVPPERQSKDEGSNAARVVAEMLAAAPKLKVIVTSRAALCISGEHEFHVLPLALPDVNHLPAPDALERIAAVTLFVQRAQAVKSDFDLNDANAATVAAICHRLDGLPLAIELAAARLKLFNAQTLLTRLADAPMEMLVAGPNDLPPRQRMLRSTIDWSYALLSANEQVAFRRLGIFAGGFTLEAADAVTGAEWPAINSLLDKSLIQNSQPSSNGAQFDDARFNLLEILREYAQEKLSESGKMEEIHKRHAEYFLKLAEQTELDLWRATPVESLDQLEAEWNNLRMALQWSLRSEHRELGLRLAGALGPFWEIRGSVSEARAWLSAFLDCIPQQEQHTVAYAKGLLYAGRLAIVQQDSGTTIFPLLEHSLMIYRSLSDKRGMALAWYFMAEIATWGWREHVAVRPLYEESLELWRELGDEAGLAWTLGSFAGLEFHEGNLQRSTALAEESLALARKLGNQRGIADACNMLSILARFEGAYKQAVTLSEQGISAQRELRDESYQVGATINLGYIALAQGDYAGATVQFQDGRALAEKRGEKNYIAWSLRGLGLAAWLQGKQAQATALHKESLLLYRSMGAPWGIAECLEGLALVACTRGGDATPDASPIKDMQDEVRGVRLLGAAEALREITRNPRPVAEIKWIQRAVTDALVAVGEAAFVAAWADGRVMTLEQVIDYALSDE